MNAQERYREWLAKLPEGSDMKKELLAIEGNEAEITDRFYQEIVFGTAGLRGICGAGTNRMNELTVGRATQGLAAYIIRSGEDRSHGVAIAYDCRHHSREFSELAARILAGNGIDFGGKRDQNLSLPVASPDAGAFVCGAEAGMRRRNQHDGQPQSEGVQRI